MNHRLVMTLLLLLACRSLHAQERVDTYALKKIVDEAQYDFSNAQMYRDMKSWVGKRIAFRGSIRNKPVIVAGEKSYEEMTGTSSDGEPIDIVTFLDAPFRKPQNIGDSGPVVTRGTIYRFFGVLGKCHDYVDISGNVKYLPTMDLLLVFMDDDRNFEYPIWVSPSLRR